ncbi:cellulose biosynthesis protein BcsG [Vibrio aphrogenes]|uniref:cellulose biosynthesis protein BcsG n=1 Tax=Vibrio aphrogenes TaxID=1891186 RepID=UPI001E4206C7|nr:cellulose biosynthesis protein BcsG [Vibrio aphrogenes]
MKKNNQIMQQSMMLGLGWWNLYFIIKLVLFAQGTIGFHPIENFAFVIYLLLPIRHKLLNSLRHVIAFPIAFYLGHYDSFLPPLERLWSQIGSLLDFQLSYLLELASRFVSLQDLLAIVVLIFAYYFLNRIFRISVFVIAAMLYFSLPSPKATAPMTEVVSAKPDSTPTNTATNRQVDESGPVNDAVLNQAKQTFFDNEATRVSTFTDNSAQAAPFDLLFLSICSVAWDDIKIAGLEDHPLFKEFDIMFDNFSAATSYSGPALVRLLRASCGQEQHEELFSDAPKQQCYLFDNLAKLGYGENLMLNHNGSFDNFTGLLKEEGHLEAPMMSKAGLEPYQAAFDGSNIYRDEDVLNRWLTQREKDPQSKVAALYNTISLHDGNRIIKESGQTGMVSYKHRLKNLLDDLYAFFDTLKQSNRNIVVMLVPEHGAGMRGDRMQISGMREIPAATIVHTPVAMKVFGPNMKRDGDTYHVTAPSSYLAVSTLISRLLEQNIYAKGSFDPKALSNDLPQTKMVAQNSGSTVMEYNNKPYVSLDGQTWQEYPQ